MILLDTHIWIWWTQNDDRLTPAQRQLLIEQQPSGLGVAAISCWEIAKAVQLGRLVLPLEVAQWLRLALKYPGVKLLRLTSDIAVESTRLPGEFHKDPADQIIVATARIIDCPLVTSDARILTYPHVRRLP